METAETMLLARDIWFLAVAVWGFILAHAALSIDWRLAGLRREVEGLRRDLADAARRPR